MTGTPPTDRSAPRTCARPGCDQPTRSRGRRYCSRPCSTQHSNDARRVPRVQRTCLWCGAPFEVMQTELLERPCECCSVFCAQRYRGALIEQGKLPPSRGTAWTEEEDAYVRRSYGQVVIAAMVVHLRRRSATAIRCRAKLLGLVPSKMPPWTPEEDDRLQELMETQPWDKIAAKLPGRTKTACQVRAKRLGYSIVDTRTHLTATMAAVMIGRDPSTVAKWIREGHLRAKAIAGRGRVGGTGGQQWAVRMQDLRDFVLEHPGDVDLRKVGDLQIEFINLIGGKS